jgi:cytochrome c-type biogenesis protein CcmH
MRKALWLLLILILLGNLAALPALAQTPTPNQIDAIAKELWCPLCNGVRLDNCELQACIQMREVIVQKLVAGENKEQIKAYFAEQYGDVVLGTPSREGFNLVVWIFPILAAVVGLGWVAYLIFVWRKRRPAAQSAPTSFPSRRQGEDEYLKRVDEELKQYD